MKFDGIDSFVNSRYWWLIPAIAFGVLAWILLT
jgi:hypothetical protein